MFPTAMRGLTLLTCVTLVTFSRAGTLPNCPEESKTAGDTGLAFSRPPISVQYSCDRGHAEIYCCVRDYSKLSWSRRETGTWDWEPVQQTSTVYFKPNSGNQTLVLERVTAPRDETRFRCVAIDALGNEIQQEISLVILDCRSLNHAPVARLPVNGTHLRLTASDFSVTCEGYYGPDYETRLYPSVMLWNKVEWSPPHEPDILETWVAGQGPETGSHVTVTLTKYNQYMESTLTIHGLTKADYANYTCILKNAFGFDVRNVQLQEGGKRETTAAHNQLQNNMSEDEQRPINLGGDDDPTFDNTSHHNTSHEHLRSSEDDDPTRTMRLEKAERVSQAVVAGLVTLVVVLVVTTAIYWIYRVEIRLYLKDKYGTPVNDDYTYDAFVVYDEASSSDQTFVLERLVPTLEDLHGYRLCLTLRDFIVGEYEADNYVDHLSRSQCHIFILSDDTLRHEWADFVFQSEAAERFHKMIFLRLPGISENAWSLPHQDPLRKALKQSKHVITWPDGRPETGNTRRHSVLKKQEMFWKKLRLALPAKLKKSRSRVNTAEDDMERQGSDSIWLKRLSFVEPT